ncbi:hypothetical protein ACFYTQ_28035 [Nocardia sp. NPDC004068]|uniref:hypothetical protein n=1 Tax=Nocardia sp. NPDC004068 TaxID=3364303 RepID=UPI0036AA0333
MSIFASGRPELPAQPSRGLEEAERLARLETKVEQLVAGNVDHETRIRALERFRWVIASASGAAGVIGTQVASRLHLFGH